MQAAKLLRFEPQAQAQAQAQTPYYPYMVGTEYSMYVPVRVPKRPSCTFTKCIRKSTSCTFASLYCSNMYFLQ